MLFRSTGRIAEWAVELQPFELEFLTTKTVKGGALAEFNAEWTNPPSEDEPDEEGSVLGTAASDRWTMHFDGGFSSDGAGAGVVLTSPTGDKLYYVVQLCFGKRAKVSNNIAEYEGLRSGIRAYIGLSIKRLIIKGDL